MNDSTKINLVKQTSGTQKIVGVATLSFVSLFWIGITAVGYCSLHGIF